MHHASFCFRYNPFKSTPEEFPTINCMKWNKSNKFWNNMNSLSRWHFRCCGCRGCLNSLIALGRWPVTLPHYCDVTAKIKCTGHYALLNNFKLLLSRKDGNPKELHFPQFLYLFHIRKIMLCEIDWKVTKQKLHWVFHSKSFKVCSTVYTLLDNREIIQLQCIHLLLNNLERYIII